MSVKSSLPGFKEHFVVRQVHRALGDVFASRVTALYFYILTFVVFLGVFGPHIAPYPPGETIYSESGNALLNQPPSMAHPFGTTATGQDVLSRVIVGARPTLITGALGGSIMITIGMTVGVTAGYFGGKVENILMRITDFAYGIPLYPFALIVIPFFGIGFYSSIVVIALLIWRGSARVIRSQVLQVKEQPYIQAIRATGASHFRIITVHILPNIMQLALLFFAMGVGVMIIIQAGLAFLGVTDPTVPSWGIILRNAYTSGYLSHSWWWSIPPGILLSLTILSTLMIGRSFERREQGDTSLATMG